MKAGVGRDAMSITTGRQACTGLSLIELLIALTLGLFIVAALGQLYRGSSKTYRLNETQAQINENGRFAIDFLSSDLRMAGYLSCGGPSARIGNSVNANGHWLYSTRGIEGFEGGVDTLPEELDGAARNGTDVLILRHTAVDVERALVEADNGGTIMNLGLQHPFQTGEVLVVSNPSCTQTGLFQVTRVVNTNDDEATDVFDAIEHDNAAATETLSPGNCSSALFGSFDCSTPGKAQSGTYPRGSVVNRYAVHAYYISASDPPTLARKRLSHHGGLVTIATDNLVGDVENLQILYGRDTTDDGEDSIDDYVTANQVTDWEQVISVRFALLMRSTDTRARAAADQQTFTLLDTTVTSPTDAHLRRVLGGLVALRNHLP